MVGVVIGVGVLLLLVRFVSARRGRRRQAAASPVVFRDGAPGGFARSPAARFQHDPRC